MKKTAALLSLLLLLTALFPTTQVSAEEPLALTAPSAVLMDAASGEVLYDKAMNEVRPCASITKVMTLCLIFQAIEEGRLQYDQPLSASAHAASMGGSDIWLKEGETMTVDDLIKATVIMSANDAAVVLAEAESGSEEAFVAKMNQKAQELGMTSTVFKNCNGLDEEGHVTTAHDVALMSRELLKYEKVQEYALTWMDYLREGETQLVNTNKLIRSYQGIQGLKTGTTAQAGSCISTAAQRENLQVIAVVLGAGSSDDRFRDAAALMDYGFANWRTAVPDLPELAPIPVKGGMLPELPVEADQAPRLLISAREAGEIETTVELLPALQAPVQAGEVVGYVRYSLSGQPLGESPIYAKAGVEAITFSSAFRYIFQWMFTI